MELQVDLIESAAEYAHIGKLFAGFVNAELVMAESTPEPNRAHAIALLLPRLISMVNVVGYFHGQDGAFHLERQAYLTESEAKNDLHANELLLEKRLQTLIEEVRNSSEAELLKEQLEQYYIKART